MSAPKSLMRAAAMVAAVGLALAGCTYDYLQHTDKVGYSAGDAVKANLESETIDPSKDAMYKTKGLGKNGQVVEPQPTELGSE